MDIDKAWHAIVNIVVVHMLLLLFVSTLIITVVIFQGGFGATNSLMDALSGNYLTS